MKYSCEESESESGEPQDKRRKVAKPKRDSSELAISEGDLLDASCYSDAPDIAKTAVVTKTDTFRPSGIQQAGKKNTQRKSAPMPDRKKDKPQQTKTVEGEIVDAEDHVIGGGFESFE